MDRPGVYVAHHLWLDAERGPDSLYKIGHTGDLSRRLGDDAYVTCFTPSWRFVYTFETLTKEDARRLEAGVLECLRVRRIQRSPGILSELAWASCDEIAGIIVRVAASLAIPGTARESPEYAPACAGTDKSPAPSRPPRPILSIQDREALAPLALSADTTMDDWIADLIDGFAEGGETGAPDLIGGFAEGGATGAPDPKSFEDYYREAKERAEKSLAAATQADEPSDDAFADDLAEEYIDPMHLGDYEIEERDYQTEAVRACLDELARGNHRTMLQMACRCGKTRVAHGVVLDYLRRPRSPSRTRILYLVPGLALLRQTARKLNKYGFRDIRPQLLLVGSDDRPVEGLAAFGPGAQCAGTTDPDVIAAACNRETGPPLLVISTYQSSPLVPDAFDLTVFDESHRTCGERRPRPFTHTLLESARGHRLYMTATPRYDAALSMKDRDLYGGVAYAYHMRQGIDAGYVNPFGIELVGRRAGGAGGAVASADQVVAAYDSLALSCGRGAKLLVFCQSIRHAAGLCREVDALFAAADEEGRPLCQTAHSRMSQQDIAAGLARFCTPKRGGILFNCRLFQEGVEIPDLNGVMFAAPRHSPRDIIQSLCRPLNVLPGKPQSKVFIPVALNPSAAPDSIDNLERFATIIPYFDALMAEDPLLYEHLLDPRGIPYPLQWVNSVVEGLRYKPEALLAAARRSVRRGGNGKTERLLRSARIPWDIGFAELKRIVEDCGRYPKTTDCFVYGDAKVNFGAFYKYVRESYAKWLAGEAQPLEPHQLRALEGLEGWATYGLEGPYPWKETLAFLDRWLRDHGGVPPMVEINKGGYVGLEATPLERLSGTLTCINQSDGRDRTSKSGEPKPGSGFTLDPEKQKDLDELCERWGLRWRKERHPAPPGCAVGSLVEDSKGKYSGAKTFIQEAYARFKQELLTRGKESDYIQQWFPGYPTKHAHQERPDVWARRKEVVPPRWRGRGKPTAGPNLYATVYV